MITRAWVVGKEGWEVGQTMTAKFLCIRTEEPGRLQCIVSQESDTT